VRKTCVKPANRKAFAHDLSEHPLTVGRKQITLSQPTGTLKALLRQLPDMCLARVSALVPTRSSAIRLDCVERDAGSALGVAKAVLFPLRWKLRTCLALLATTKEAVDYFDGMV
jgi:hypothetical protein